MSDISLLMLMHIVTGILVVFSGMTALIVKMGSTKHKYAGRFYVSLLTVLVAIVAIQAFISPEPIQGNFFLSLPQLLVVILALFWISRLTFSTKM